MSLFLDLQLTVAARIEEQWADEPGLRDLEVLTEAKGDLGFAIKEQLQKIGFGVTVLTPAYRKGEEPATLDVDVTVVITERVLWNQSVQGRRRTATEVSELVYCALSRWSPGAAPGKVAEPGYAVWGPLEFQSWAPREVSEEEQAVIWSAVFRTTIVPAVTETQAEPEM